MNLKELIQKNAGQLQAEQYDKETLLKELAPPSTKSIEEKRWYANPERYRSPSDCPKHKHRK